MKTFNKSLIAAAIATTLSTSYADQSLVGQQFDIANSQNHAVKLKDGKVVEDFKVDQNLNDVVTTKSTSGTAPTGLTIGETYTGQEAIDFLGVNFDAIAQKAGLEPDYLKDQLLNDTTLRITKDGSIIVVDTGIEKEQILVSDKVPTPANSIPFTGDAFKLHSKPGASKVIYLDFDGHNTVSQGWGDANTIGFDTDGDPTTFSTSEKNNINGVFNIVADDYAAFDVDVTTEEPTQDQMVKSDASDQTYGMRVGITSNYPVTIPVVGNISIGGIAYIGSMETMYSPSYTNPEYRRVCWVFAKTGLGNGVKAIAEAASHEVGHTLKLYHHGIKTHDGINGATYYTGHGGGQTGWAPIMGVGYYRNTVTWSNAAYPYASNTAQDDKAVISTILPVIPDDWADTSEQANTFLVEDKKPLVTDLSGRKFLATKIQPTYGVIGTSTEVDRFTFSTSTTGPVDFRAFSHDSYVDYTVQDPETSYDLLKQDSGNLDIKMTLYDANNNLVVSVDDQNYLSSIVHVDALPAGRYYLEISSGKHDATPTDAGYSTYGSMGQYVITGRYTNDEQLVPPVPVMSIENTEGVMPLTITFSANGSTAGSGAIESYYWDFGCAGSTESNSTAILDQPGTYIPKLTIKNTFGDTATIEGPVITVYPWYNHTFAVKSIKETAVKVKKNTAFKAVVAMFSPDSKQATMNVKVHGKFTGTYRLVKNGVPMLIEDSVPADQVVTTDKKGNATFTTPTSWLIKGGATVKFEVTGVDSPVKDQAYDKYRNLVTATTLIKK